MRGPPALEAIGGKVKTTEETAGDLPHQKPNLRATEKAPHPLSHPLTKPEKTWLRTGFRTSPLQLYNENHTCHRAALLSSFTLCCCTAPFQLYLMIHHSKFDMDIRYSTFPLLSHFSSRPKSRASNHLTLLLVCGFLLFLSLSPKERKNGASYSFMCQVEAHFANIVAFGIPLQHTGAGHDPVRQ
jgi:hypothetical protein